MKTPSQLTVDLYSWITELLVFLWGVRVSLASSKMARRILFFISARKSPLWV